MELNNKVADILDELFKFDGQMEELCTLSEMESDFGMSYDEMVYTLKEFIEKYKGD